MRIEHTKKKRCRKKQRQRWKSVVQTNEQCCNRKTMENLRNKIDIKVVSNKKDYLQGRIIVDK